MILPTPMISYAEGLHQRPRDWMNLHHDYKWDESEIRAKYPQGAYALSVKAHHIFLSYRDSNREIAKKKAGLPYDASKIGVGRLTSDGMLYTDKDITIKDYPIKKGQDLTFNWAHTIPWTVAGLEDTIISFRDEEISEWTKGGKNENNGHTHASDGAGHIQRIESMGLQDLNLRTKVNRIIAEAGRSENGAKRGGHYYKVELKATNAQLTSNQVSENVKLILLEWFSKMSPTTGYIDKPEKNAQYKTYLDRLTPILQKERTATRPWTTSQAQGLARHLLMDRGRMDGEIISHEIFTPAVIQYFGFGPPKIIKKEDPVNCGDFTTSPVPQDVEWEWKI